MRNKNAAVNNETETFVVRVRKGAGDAWQGNITWVSEHCEQHFDSMQELFELMDSSLKNCG